MIGYRISLWRKSLRELQREHMYISESVNSLSDIQGERTRNQIGGEEDHFKWHQLNPVVDHKGKKKDIMSQNTYFHLFHAFTHGTES